MTFQADETSPRRRSERLPMFVVGAGLFLLGSSGLAKSSLKGPVLPGKLVAKQDSLVWRSPLDPTYRRLNVDEAQAVFELENVGGSPVRIVGTETSCGCAQPEVRPLVIPPGGTGSVLVRALPLQMGEKVAVVTLKTDALSTPVVRLRLQIIGSRRPPYLARVAGDLSFEGEMSPAETREIFVTTIELAGSSPTPPVVESDLPFLEIGRAALAEESAYRTPEAVSRKYVYETRLAKSPVPQAFSGEVLVTDPWDSQNAERLRVHGKSLPPLRVVPPRLVLRLPQNPGPESDTARILILSKYPAPDLVAEREDPGANPLILGPVESGKDDRRASVSVAVKPGAVREGVYNVLVGRSSSPDRVVVPVAVRLGDGQ